MEEQVIQITKRLRVSKLQKYRVYLQYILLGVLLSLIPIIQQAGIYFRSSTVITIGTVIIYAIVALGLNLLLGYSGLVTLGTAGFMGLAAYASAYFTVKLELPFLLSFVLSVTIPVVISLLIGLASLRIEGYYLAIATLGVAEIFRKLFERLTNITEGFTGINTNYPKIFGFQFGRTETFIFIVVIFVLLMIVMHHLVNSRTGRALLAMRGSQPAAKAMGVNILKYRLLAFSISTFFAAVGGVLYVHFIQFTHPSDWILNRSLNVLAMVVIGGMRSIGGALLGAFIVEGFKSIVFDKIPLISNLTGLSSVFNGGLLILVVMIYPRGIIHLPRDIYNKLKEVKQLYDNRVKKKVNQLNDRVIEEGDDRHDN